MVTPPPTAESPWPVGLFAGKIRDWIDRLGTAWVEGEITQWNVAGGNVYGKLKDLEIDATVSFSVWSSVRGRIPADLKQGDRVIAAMKPNFWVKGGSLTMQVFDMRHVGLGDLLERLERLRQTLTAEGLFAPERKRPLPFLPQRIGLITGKDSDAEKDVLRNAQLRWPSVQFCVVHAAVQGERMVAEVTAALLELDADPEVDVIIVARGGGDFQNLLGFSDEGLIRAAAAATTPIVSAIGHENDRPLLDDVADLRASTPTDAAKRVVPDVGEELLRVQQARARMSQRLTNLIGVEIDRLGQFRSRPVLANPQTLIDVRADELVRWVARSEELLQRAIERGTTRLAELTGRLRALSPESTLRRGYSIAQLPSGAILRDGAEAPAGTDLVLTLATGALGATSTGPLTGGSASSTDGSASLTDGSASLTDGSETSDPAPTSTPAR
nr:exodeoxyribonuclease VII large subunit [Frondihabitans australicus]